MAVITITFICNFSAAGKNKTKDKSKSRKKDKKRKIKITEEQVENTNVINVKKPLKYLHIEYNLLPANPNCNVDVCFWGSIAKIYTKGENKAIKTITIKNKIWVSFSIKHIFKLNLDQILRLKSHTINFSLSASKAKISSRAKNDGVKTFYLLQQDVESQRTFIEAYEIDPNVISSNLQTSIQIRNIIQDLIRFPIENEVLNVLKHIPDELHCKKIEKVIEKLSDEISVDCFNDADEFVNIKDLISTKKGKGKKNKKKKQKTKKGKGLKLSVSGEILFTDPNFPLFRFKTSNADLSQAFVVIQVENLMSLQQINELKPFIIKIDVLENLPADILTSNGFSHVYLKYNIGNDIYTINARQILNKITFKEHHIHFMKDSISNQFVEQLQSGYITIEIHGIRIIKKVKTGELFGHNIDDQFISTIMQNTDEIQQYLDEETKNAKSILLAIVNFKLDLLLKPFWIVSSNNNCLHPKNIEAQLEQELKLPEKITINLINANACDNEDDNPLNDGIFLTNGTRLSVTLQACKSISNSVCSAQKEENLYNRIILIIHDTNLEKLILTNVIQNNLFWLEKNDFVLPNYLIKTDVNNFLNVTNLITGFVVDGGNFFIMFLEGTNQLITSLIWDEIADADKNAFKVLYNSGHVFKKQIYFDFITYGGLYIITLYRSLMILLQEKKIYLRRYLPEPCRMAFRKLDLILKSKMMKDITPGLLPTLKELLSLDFEWGIPFYWSVKEN